VNAVRSKPCLACPYRRDVPSGVWAHEEYEKLRAYDEPTGDQPTAIFACHATPEHLCNGWAVVHTSRGHEFDLLALRLVRGGYPEIPVSDIELWSSGDIAADHGQADIEDPSPEADATVARLLSKYTRLSDG
jgi:hypothetical protein